MATITYDLERPLRGAVAAVRGELVAALHELKFKLTTEQLTLIEARRGSNLAASAMMMGKQMPLRLTAHLQPTDDGCHLAVHIEDALLSGRAGMKTWGVNGAYEAVCNELQQRLDARLRRLDAAARWEPGRFVSSAGRIAVLEKTTLASGRSTGAVIARADQILSGGALPSKAQAWKGVDAVTFRDGGRAAQLSTLELQAHLAIAVMVSMDPEALPPALRVDLECFAARVEQTLVAAHGAAVSIDLVGSERKVLDFMHQQTRTREALPLRTLHRCRTCKLEKITNPDFQRLQKRNARLRTLGSAVGAHIGKGGISPFVLVGTVFKFSKLDPDFVCARCQGTDAEERVVTFCPECGDLRREVVLRACVRCQHDLRTATTDDDVFWVDAATLAPAVQSYGMPVGVPLGMPVGPPASAQAARSWLPAAGSAPGGPPPATGSAPTGPPRATLWKTPASSAPALKSDHPASGPQGGKLCRCCGAEFPTLWRVTISGPAGPEPWFVCGQTMQCSPRSLTPPAPA